MALNSSQQLNQLLQGKKNILITFQRQAQGDAIASSIALFLFLEKQGHRVDIVSEEFELPKAFKFLKNANKIKDSFSHLQKFIITVDAEKTGVQELSYDLKGEKLRVFVTPKKGYLTRDNIRTAQSDFKYDIIFVLNTPDLEALGELYDNNTELFYKKPIVNIDHGSNNEHFGQLNIVNLTATSTAEVLFELLQKMGEEYIDEAIATAILTGMIANTRSFKTHNIKPHTLYQASKLMSLGADRDHIIKNLYRTRTLPTLKLWGQALAHLQHDNSCGLVWTTITRDDLTRSGGKAEDLYEIVDELIGNSPEAKLTLLFHEQDNGSGINVILNASQGFDAQKLLQPFGPKGNDSQASCIVNKTLKEVEEEVIQYIKKLCS